MPEIVQVTTFNYGQSMVKVWSNYSQIMVELSSICQIMVKVWSKYGQIIVTVIIIVKLLSLSCANDHNPCKCQLSCKLNIGKLLSKYCQNIFYFCLHFANTFYFVFQERDKIGEIDNHNCRQLFRLAKLSAQRELIRHRKASRGCRLFHKLSGNKILQLQAGKR